MGCGISTSGVCKKRGYVSQVVVFVPGLRVPKSIEFGNSLNDHSLASRAERLSALRTRISAMTVSLAQINSKTSTLHESYDAADLLQALEDYLPILLGLEKEGNQLRDLVEFSWINQEDCEEETSLTSTWYEVLSVLHMMAMICLLEANSLLIPKAPADGYQPKVSEEDKKSSIDMFLKAAGYLHYGARYILVQMPTEVKRNLPIDLQEEVLQAMSAQALGQCVEIQLGMAIDSPKATLAVKRRLACEQVEYWSQAQHCISNVRFGNGWGQKHLLYIKWKFAEAKAAAYYFHGLLLDEGSEENARGKAVACLHAAEHFLKESKSASIKFCLTAPVTRIPPIWGAMKYLAEKIPKDASSKAEANKNGYNFQKLSEDVPKLPTFPGALKPDEYEMPPVDPSWN